MLSRRLRKQRRGRRWLTALTLVSIVSGTLFVGNVVLASTPAGLFELEGDAASNANGDAPDDWDRVCYEQSIESGLSVAAATAQCGTDDDTNDATAVAWAEDVHGAVGPLGECTGNNCTIFTGGGSKDPIDINQWAWKDNAGGLPDKDNLLHSFAARYSIPSSATCPGANGNTTGATKCEMLFFGNDRYDNSGDAHQAFWFFQNKIGLGTNAIGGGQGFTSSGGTEFHRNGDLLLISNFSNGGSVSTIFVYTWDTACKADNMTKTGSVGGVSCGDANLRFQASSDVANCNPVNPALTGFCGIVNPTDNTVAPWPYVDKTTTSDTTHLPNTYLQGEFYEGGVNLSFLDLGGECFASVASETRASTSTTAVLKDFVLGDFGECTSTITTTPKKGDGSAISTDVNNNGVPDLSIGSGSVAVRDLATVTVDGVSTWTGSVAFTLCKLPLSPTTSNCLTGGVAIPFVASATGVVSNASPTVSSQVTTLSSVGRYCWRATFTSNVNGVPPATDPDAVKNPTSTVECFEVLPVQPTMTTDASGPVAVGSTLTDTATISGLATQPGTGGLGDGSINATAMAADAGSITWRALGPNNCTAVAMTSTSRTVSGNGTYPTAEQTAVGFTANSVGKYTFVAGYGTENPNNLGITESACPDLTGTEEAFVGDASITTTPGNSTGTALTDHAPLNTVPDVSIGTGSVQVRDRAVVTVQGITPWSGSVSFKLCGPLALSPITTNCASGGVTIPFTGGATGAVSNSSPTVDSGLATLTKVGRYCWQATFTSSTAGVPNSTDPGPTSASTTECFEVLPVQPTMTTDAGPSVVLGNPITDTASISGLATQPGTGGLGDGSINPTTAGLPAAGTINWSAFGPDDCETALTVTPSSITISGNNNAGKPSYGPVSATPTALGLYTFVASYTTADVNNLSIAASACPDLTETETVIVTGVSSFVTAQDWLPNDKATLTGDANLNGTLTFTLYNDATCGQGTGTSKYTKSITVTNAVSGSNFFTDNTSFLVKAGDGSNWSWLVTYNDTTLSDPPASCKEDTTITIDNTTP